MKKTNVTKALTHEMGSQIQSAVTHAWLCLKKVSLTAQVTGSSQ